MKSYDFNNSFSPGEFQDFARDIVQIKENIFLESFAEGRDMGIDGRSVANDGYTIIFQAKRLKNGAGKIMTVMYEEKKKMDKLREMGKRIDRYILAVSDDLQPDTKDKVCQIMSPYIIAPQDILTRRDFNNLLSQKEYRIVEDKYYQLWIPSANVLREKLFELVNSALVQRSIECYKSVLEKKTIFVETAAFKEAVQRLQKNRVIIISGEPGVGKTTLAEQLSLYYFAKYHFRAFVSVSSVEELYTALGIEGRKVILYDDFWGSSGFDRFGSGKESGELVTFIDHIRRNKDCLLVMTTREYILEQGLEQNEELRRMVEEYKLECRVERYTNTEKLRIYYGHLKNSRLTWEQTRELQRNYHRVIYSPNYNPRVIKLFTEYITPDMSPEECVEEFDKYIQCPSDFWKRIFRDLSSEAKLLYVLTLLFPMPIEMELLEKSYNDQMKIQGNALEWKSFSDAVIELEKTVIRTDLYKRGETGILTVTYQNPSVKDFLIALIKENFEKYHAILSRNCQYYAQYVEYLKVLDQIGAPGEIYAKIYERTVEAISSESILFYDKYKIILQYTREIEKLSERYETERSYRDIGFGRIFQLILMYKDSCGEKMKTELSRIFQSAMQEISCYPELALPEDLHMLPEVIIAVYRTGICKKAFWMLDVYFNSMMRNREPISDTRIMRALPDIWTEYAEIHRDQVAEYLGKYYEAELCVAAVEGDGDEFAYQCFRCEENYEEYDLKIPEELNEKMKLYDTWVSVQEETDEFQEDHYDRKEESEGDINKDFKENFLNSILPIWIEDTEQWIELRMVQPEVKKILKQAYDGQHVVWSSFLYDEDSLEFLESFIIYSGGLSEDIAEILEGITRYIEEKSGLDKETFLEFMTCLEKRAENKRIWSEAEVEEACPEILFANEDLLGKMTEAHILVNRHHWYRVVNELLVFCIRMTVCVLSSNKRQEYYIAIQEQIKNGHIPHEDGMFWETLKTLEPGYYERYILAPVSNALYKRIMESGETWINAWIDYFNIAYEFEKDEITGGSCNGDPALSILETYLGFDPMEALMPEFSDKQIRLMKMKGILRSEEQTVTLRELEEHGLLAEFGLYEKIERLWNQICKWQLEVQYET